MKPRLPVTTHVNVLERNEVDRASTRQVGGDEVRARRRKPHPAGFAVAVALCAQSLSAQPVSGTLVVVLGTRERIVVAADSRSSWVSSPGAAPTRFRDSDCKVFLDSPLVLAIAGVQADDGFSVPLQWKKLSGNREAVFDRAKTLNAAIGALEFKHVPFKATITVVVAGFFALEPASAISQFELRPGEPHPIRIRSDGGAASPVVVVLGESDSVDVDGLQSRLRQPISEQDMVAIAEKTIRGEALRHQTIGGDIDVAVIDANGARWSRVKRQCDQPGRK